MTNPSSSFVLPNCAMCGVPCVPMADYDAPTCIGCDDAMAYAIARAARTGYGAVVVEKVIEVERIIEKVVEVAVPVAQPLQPHGTHAAFLRHWRADESPCDDCREGERIYRRDKQREVRAAQRAARYGQLAALQIEIAEPVA